MTNDPTTSAGPLVQLRDVSRVFATAEIETHALAHIDLEVQRGEFLSISGPSGGGKSTLLSILGLLDVPTHGTYTLCGQRVDSLSATQRARIRRERIGFVFQGFNLIGELSVWKNVELPLTYRGRGAEQRKTLVRAALERVGMTHRANHLPSQLSGGQQQRVAVARAVVGNPQILLADEPTGNLDSEHGQDVMELLHELNLAGTTICMVTHDPRYGCFASREVHLVDGKLSSPPVKTAPDWADLTLGVEIGPGH